MTTENGSPVPVRCPRAGIGSEFGLSPHLLRAPGPSAHISVRTGRRIWLNSGRAAIKWALQALRQVDPVRATCLLPAYLCSSVVQPFKEAGVNVIFYRVDDRLQVDLDDLHTRIGPDVLAVLVIHYFGFPQSDTVFDVIASTKRQIYVIEDATHAWLSRSTDGRLVGERGTITVYSPRKFFPVPDGGIAIVEENSRALNVDVSPTDWGFALQRTTGLLLRWLFGKTRLALLNRLAFSFLRRAEHKLDTAVWISEASWISRRVLLNLEFDVAAERRRQNYRILSEGVLERRLPVQPLYKDLLAGVTPLGFPLLCKRRDALRQFLIERRVYTSIHWLLPREQGIGNFGHLVTLSEQILTLPVDQRYGRDDMEYILTCLNEWGSMAL